MDRVDLAGADLALARFDDATLTRSDLHQARLVGASLKNVKAADSTLDSADLTRADLTNADLRRSTLGSARCVRTDAPSANLSGCNLARADFTGADLRHCDLRRATLDGADFTGANLTDAEITVVALAAGILRGTTLPDGSIRTRIPVEPPPVPLEAAREMAQLAAELIRAGAKGSDSEKRLDDLRRLYAPKKVTAAQLTAEERYQVTFVDAHNGRNLRCEQCDNIWVVAPDVTRRSGWWVCPNGLHHPGP